MAEKSCLRTLWVLGGIEITGHQDSRDGPDHPITPFHHESDDTLSLFVRPHVAAIRRLLHRNILIYNLTWNQPNTRV